MGWRWGDQIAGKGMEEGEEPNYPDLAAPLEKVTHDGSWPRSDPCGPSHVPCPHPPSQLCVWSLQLLVSS